MYYRNHEEYEAARIKCRELAMKEPGNQPEDFDTLSLSDQITLMNWISVKFTRRQTINNSATSYGLKHCFERDENGFYITNGMFKGAVQKMGFEISGDLNWCINITQKSIRQFYFNGGI